MRGLVMLVAVPLLGCDDRAREPAEQSLAEPASRVSVSSAGRAVGSLFPTATEVRLFVNTGYDADGHPIMTSGKTLTRSQRETFEAAMRIEPAPESLAACFIPHHFFRYFDAQGSQIGEVEVCFCCEGVEVSRGASAAPGRAEQFGADYAALKRLVEAMGERTDIEC